MGEWVLSHYKLQAKQRDWGEEKEQEEEGEEEEEKQEGDEEEGKKEDAAYIYFNKFRQLNNL